jgi:hypothetical protein
MNSAAVIYSNEAFKPNEASSRVAQTQGSHSLRSEHFMQRTISRKIMVSYFSFYRKLNGVLFPASPLRMMLFLVLPDLI